MLSFSLTLRRLVLSTTRVKADLLEQGGAGGGESGRMERCENGKRRAGEECGCWQLRTPNRRKLRSEAYWKRWSL